MVGVRLLSKHDGELPVVQPVLGKSPKIMTDPMSGSSSSDDESLLADAKLIAREQVLGT